jgi:ABC-type phosphate transport system substrate-binding protein
LLGAFGVGTASAWFAAVADAKPEFRVIVHPKNRIQSASKKFLTDAFLKKTTRWEDGEAIKPVDREPKSAVRKSFTKSVLERSVAAVRNYWQQRIFSGRGVPPPELDSDEEVVAYVLKHRGAVGYVSGSAELRGANAIEVG